MLDSAQYDPVNLVEGRLGSRTLAWMEGILKKRRRRRDFRSPHRASQPAVPEPDVHDPVRDGEQRGSD